MIGTSDLFAYDIYKSQVELCQIRPTPGLEELFELLCLCHYESSLLNNHAGAIIYRVDFAHLMDYLITIVSKWRRSSLTRLHSIPMPTKSSVACKKHVDNKLNIFISTWAPLWDILFTIGY